MRFFRAFKSLYVQVLCGVVLGVLCGHLFPEIAAYAKPFGDGFVRLIKMLIAPIVFCTIVMGIANMHDLKKLGRVGGKAFLYFEVVSTLALVIGLIVAKWLAPGEGMNVDPSTLDGGALATYTQAAATQKGTAQFLLEIIPNSFVDAFARSDLLQVLLCSVLVERVVHSLVVPGEQVSRQIAGAAGTPHPPQHLIWHHQIRAGRHSGQVAVEHR